MKRKVTKELWVMNLTGKNVSITDLGVRIPPKKAVNIYQHNPYITEYQVIESKANGVLAKKIESKEVMILVKKVNPTPPDLNKIKQSDGVMAAKKTKSSVIIEATQDTDENGESFDFADYGINDLGPVTQERQDDGTVVVNAAQDEGVESDKGIDLKPQVESGLSNQSQIVMKNMQESMTDPTGPIAQASQSTAEKPFTVVKPPQPEKEPEASVSVKQEPKKDASGTIVIDGVSKGRSLKGIKKAQEEGVEEDFDDSVVEFEETPFDSKAATKTDDGAVIMKIKEEVVEKPKTKAVEKAPRSSKEK